MALIQKYQLGPQKLTLVQITGIRCTERLIREQRTGTTDNKERGRTDGDFKGVEILY